MSVTQVSGGTQRTAADPSAGPTPSYWFYMVAPSQNVKQLTTYCGLGYQVDYQEDDSGTKSWEDLMTAALPAIQADIDQWGLP